jgi:hypothetical protein
MSSACGSVRESGPTRPEGHSLRGSRRVEVSDHECRAELRLPSGGRTQGAANQPTDGREAHRPQVSKVRQTVGVRLRKYEGRGQRGRVTAT